MHGFRVSAPYMGITVHNDHDQYLDLDMLNSEAIVSKLHSCTLQRECRQRKLTSRTKTQSAGTFARGFRMICLRCSIQGKESRSENLNKQERNVFEEFYWT
jgi:hypothetical protein